MNTKEQEKLQVLSTSRAIRYAQLKEEGETLFLSRYMSMGDFISRLCVVDSYMHIDEETRTLLLLEASAFENFSKLRIERNFFTFTKNSSYIFKFFSELSAELYEIHQLKNADLYGEYEEHIEILCELYERYKQLCKEKKYLDRIFLPDLYVFNKEFVAREREIFIHLDGYLTNFEFKLLEQCSAYTEIIITLVCSEFNTKVQERFRDKGLDLQEGFRYVFSLNRYEVLEKHKIEIQNNVSLNSFSEPLLQVAFVKAKIYEYVKKGYRPEHIAVITPNELYAQMLKTFDEKHNLNIAMGIAYTKSTLYTKIQAHLTLLSMQSYENSARVQRVGDELYADLKSVYYKSASEIDFTHFLEKIREYFTNKRELKIYDEELHRFKKVLLFTKELSVKALFKLFMQNLSQRTLDDVHGGKVTVMGVLETRGLMFDGVIVIDFDETNVPKKSNKDMFLNSSLREIAKLPTLHDRENLQKHYYQLLFNASKEVALSYVSSDEKSGSKFLKELKITQKKSINEREYAQLLFPFQEREFIELDEKRVSYSFKDVPLSASRLKTYLSCQRKYYFKYVKHLKGHEIPKEIPKEYEIGSKVHLALQNLYEKRSSYDDYRLLQKDLDKELESLCTRNEYEKYLISLQKKILQKFCRDEVTRFASGWSVKYVEKTLHREFAGMKIVGSIDRIDIRDAQLEVLDYKTGKYVINNKRNFTQTVDFQLEFYYLLAQSLGEVGACSFYDLKTSKIVKEAFLQEKLALLEGHIKDLLQVEALNTQRCEDIKECLYCEYKIMCERA